MHAFYLNDQLVRTGQQQGLVLLDYLRSGRMLTGTKEGCREGDCGACMVLLGQVHNQKIAYRQQASCLLPMAAVSGCHILTIEGLNAGELTPVQNIFAEEGAAQCGFCTPGFILSLTAFLINSSSLDEKDLLCYLDGNLCRCTGYGSIKRAAFRINNQFCDRLRPIAPGRDRLPVLADAGIVPAYLSEMETRLKKISSPTSATDTPGNGNGILVAGGTDLFVQQAEHLHDEQLSILGPSTGITVNGNTCEMDALTTIEEMRNAAVLQQSLPQIKQDFTLIASMPVRQRGTLGGNIMNASPIGDLSIYLLALNAKVRLGHNGTTREVNLRDLFLAYKSLAAGKGERIASIVFDLPEAGDRYSFEKVSKRKYLDIASVNSAMFLREKSKRIEHIHLSMGGVAPVPLYCANTVEFLTGKRLTGPLLREGAAILMDEISPISDIRGSAEYKRLLAHRLYWAHWLKWFPDIAEGEVL